MLRFRLFVRRFGLFYLTDVVIWAAAILSAQVFRFDLDFSLVQVRESVQLLLVVAASQLVMGVLTGLYRSRFRTGSFDEIRAIFFSTLGVMISGSLMLLAFQTPFVIPRATMVIAAPIAFSLLGLTRYVARALREQSLKPGETAERTIIFGAGSVGTHTVQSLLIDKNATLKPILFLDDDGEKRNYSVRGIRVMGTLDDLVHLAGKTRASTLLVCIGRADSALLQRVNEIASRADVRVLVLPPFDQILEKPNSITSYRDLSIEDLIGRHPVDLELDSISKYVRGNTVLVTGAGGSIGSELCRQLKSFDPAELIMLDRDETALQELQIQLAGNGLLDSSDVVLADIRDKESLQKIFVDRKPKVVFHAAALKHVPLLEKYPVEAWKTNVIGTQNLLDVAIETNVETFVNISTDKAAAPTSVLGHSKRVAEKLTAAAGKASGKRFLSVRFGNVIGSRGSMLPTFQALIDAGGPLTVTHADVTRFFMTIPEACQLVIQAGALGSAGEVLILDMGESVRILDIAERMIKQSGKSIQIVFTGLRQGEKLHEELFGPGESVERPFHEKISHTSVKPLPGERLDFDEWLSRLSE